jgi:hypothetical protein
VCARRLGIDDLQQATQRVDHLMQKIEQLYRQFDLCALQCSENILQGLAQSLDISRTYGARSALQTVRRPERRVEDCSSVTVAGLLLQLQQTGGDALDVLLRFDLEGRAQAPHELVVFTAHGTLTPCTARPAA